MKTLEPNLSSEREELIDQLTRFCHDFDLIQSPELSEDQFKATLQVLLDKNRILTSVDENGRLLGYSESWKINEEQLGRIILGKRFDVGVEDIETGNIAFFTNAAIHPDYRKTSVIRELRNKFLEQNWDCEYFVGRGRRKRHSPISVMKNPSFYKLEVSTA